MKSFKKISVIKRIIWSLKSTLPEWACYYTHIGNRRLVIGDIHDSYDALYFEISGGEYALKKNENRIYCLCCGLLQEKYSDTEVVSKLREVW